MIPRKLFATIEKSLSTFPAIGLIGSRQTGKTTLAQQIAARLPGKSLYLDLEKPSAVQNLQNRKFTLSSILINWLCLMKYSGCPGFSLCCGRW